MKVTAIIPTLNEEEFLEDCLIALRNQTYPIDEIIVIDSGSEDRTVEIAQKYADKILFGIRNIGYNRELGRIEAKNEIILSTDGDTIMPENWLEEAIKYFNNPNIVGVTGSIKPFNSNVITNINCWFRNAWNHIFPSFVNRGCCFLFRNSLDTSFCDEFSCRTFGEDAQLRKNLMKSGKVVYDKNLYVITEIPNNQQFKTFAIICASLGIILLSKKLKIIKTFF